MICCATCGVTPRARKSATKCGRVVGLVGAERRDGACRVCVGGRSLRVLPRRSAKPLASEARPNVDAEGLRCDVISMSTCAEYERRAWPSPSASASIRICRRLVRFVAPLLPVKIHGRSVWIVGRLPRLVTLLLKALERMTPCFDQCVPSTVVKCSADISPSFRDGDDSFKEQVARRRTPASAPCSSGTEDGIEARLVQVHPEEESKHQVVVEALAELALASYRVQDD